MVDGDQIKMLIENCTRKMAEIINLKDYGIFKHLHRLGYVSQYYIWVSHDLSEKNLMNCISICDLLLKRNENIPFLKWMITSDEK